jgi:hypothetical protein
MRSPEEQRERVFELLELQKREAFAHLQRARETLD